MLRAAVLRLFLAVLLFATGLAGGSSLAGTKPAAAEPAAVVAVPASQQSIEGPSPQFGFSRVLDQVTTTVSKVATSINNTPVTNPKNVTLSPGQTIIYTVSGQVQNLDSPDVVDIFDSSLSYVFDTGQCFPAADTGITVNFTTQPSSVGGVLICNPLLFGTNQSFSFQITFTVQPNAQPHTDPNFNVACVEGGRSQNLFNLCDSVAGTVSGGQTTPTPTPTPTPPTVPCLPCVPFLDPGPPLLLPPPPPPPPLLPPPPLGVGTGAIRGAPMAPVPVIPEADSVLLVVGGLGALGLVAAWRRRRPRS